MRRRLKALPQFGRSRLSQLPSPRLPRMPRIGRTRLLLFLLAMMGPGLITANADNDAGGDATYSMAVAVSAKHALAVTADYPKPGGYPGDGRPHGGGDRPGAGGAVRERFRLKLTLFAMAAMLIANLGTTISEFSGIASSFQLFGASQYYTIAFRGESSSGCSWYAVPTRSPSGSSWSSPVSTLTYVVSGFIAHPDWGGRCTAPWCHPSNERQLPSCSSSPSSARRSRPWGQFFIQAYVVDKAFPSSISALHQGRGDS